MSVISNYGELKARVQDYINRTNVEVTTNIPLFIELAERRIFRKLRIPSNEAFAEWLGVTTESVALPKDYLEAKILYAGDKQLTRISHQRFLQLKTSRGAEGGLMEHFCRIGPDIHFFRTPDAATDIRMVYWQDFSGTMVDNTDTNPILGVAPELYLFGACLQAQPYLKNDKRIQVWQIFYEGTMEDLEWQKDEAEYSGSNVAVTNAMGGDL